VATGVADSLREGIGLGRSPRVIAARIRDRFGMGLNRALRISRTETLRAFREGTRASYASNPVVVRGYRRVAAQDSLTCMACIALDGKRYDLGSYLDEHVNGRCALVPITPTYRELGIPISTPSSRVGTAQTWFKRQPVATQRGMMGDGKYEAWKSGKFDLDDMATTQRDAVWGNQAVETPLKDLLRAA
jgi:SPP1 gp7 family putative phage head morphogenesis protein